MKNCLLAVLAIFCATQMLHAQSEMPRELGVRFDNLDLNGSSFSLIYKKEKSENKFNRWRAAFGNVSLVASGENNTAFSIGLNAAYGIEKRKPLSDKFSFCRGPEFGAGFSFQAANDNTGYSVNTYAGYILGLQYNVGKHFFMNLEIIPSFHLGVQEALGSDKTVVSTGANFSSNAGLTTGWRF